jgi:hypothetical protein
MKLNFTLVFLVLAAQVHFSEQGFFSGIVRFASRVIFGPIINARSTRQLQVSVQQLAYEREQQQFLAGAQNEVLKEMNAVVSDLNNLYDKQLQQNNENYVNIMLELNGIEGKFDSVTNQVTSIDGKIIDITFMLKGMDEKLNSITDLVTNIDGKMVKFSSQVRMFV